MKHITVYAQAGSFAAWPANNSIWSWEGQELLVGFTVGGFQEKPGHNINEPYRSLLARSTDQGESWQAFQPANFVGSAAEARPLDRELDLNGSGFAMRVVGTGYHGSTRPTGAFYASQDRGASWEGPFSFGALGDCHELAGMDITSRTDYQVQGPGECLLMMSARRGDAMPMDRAFCARTSDGGRSFRFVSWVVPPTDPYRGVMPSTVRSASGHLVTAIRRRNADIPPCWIDAYVSADEGQSWRLAGRVGDTGGGNGNPPALTRLRDGRLCCVFGERDNCRILARYSADDGKTWGQEIVLRSDFVRDRHGDPDLGYARVMQRADGKMIALYYWATQELFHQHIAATIWDPTPGAEGDA